MAGDSFSSLGQASISVTESVSDSDKSYSPSIYLKARIFRQLGKLF
jgi:hypothetical protein